VQQAHIKAYHLFGWVIDQSTLYLTGENHIPVRALALDGACFDPTFRKALPLHFDIADLGEAQAQKQIVRRAEACLRIRETMIARVALIARIASKLSRFDSLKKTLKCRIHAAQHILQYLRIDFLVFWPFLFESWELFRLLGERGSILACEGLARL
jgi:hypothetical protein